jgi:hypothetical protein
VIAAAFAGSTVTTNLPDNTVPTVVKAVPLIQDVVLWANAFALYAPLRYQPNSDGVTTFDWRAAHTKIEYSGKARNRTCPDSHCALQAAVLNAIAQGAVMTRGAMNTQRAACSCRWE